MSTPVIANARQTVAAPVRTARRYGIFSVVDPIDSGDAHWMLGGLTSDGEECSAPEIGEIVCGPSTAKTSRSWYSDIDGDPWLTYMYETCKTVGRYDESSARLRARFEAAEQSAVEDGLTSLVLSSAPVVTPTDATLVGAVVALEQDANAQYGGQIILYVPPAAVAEEPAYFERVGDHLETKSGNLVTVGNYGDGGQVWGSGALTLYRSDLAESGPVLGNLFTLPNSEGLAYTNDYYVLVERAYSALVDCWSGQADVGGP